MRVKKMFPPSPVCKACDNCSLDTNSDLFCEHLNRIIWYDYDDHCEHTFTQDDDCPKWAWR